MGSGAHKMLTSWTTITWTCEPVFVFTIRISSAIMRNG